ncbi:MMPL family transporter [Streptomyces lunalinharesii]|uniref:MMPL family transporter n=1 Tax=Streptomyces lunalinharesii TaxID=333384 RepID=A0ABP6DMS7_9ACTN
MSSPNAPDRRRPEGALRRLGEWCARHAVVVVVLWLVGLAAVQVLQRTCGGRYADDFWLPGAQSTQGRAVLTAHHPTAGGDIGQVVLHADRPLTEVAGRITNTRAALARLPAVRSAQSPLPPPGARPAPPPPGAARTGPLAADGRTGYLTVHLRDAPADLETDVLAGVDRAVAPLRAAGVRVEYGGALGALARPAGDDRLSELVGCAVALLVLLAGFGSVLAAGVPLLTALIGVVGGLGCLGLLGAAVPFAAVSPALATMLGLGVGIDSALFLIARHRQFLADGAPPAVAAGRAVASSGRTVLRCGGTVLLALAGLPLTGVGFLTGLGVAAALTVVTALLTALTLVPALLGLLGRRIGRSRVPRPGAAEVRAPGPRRPARHPWPYAVGAVLVLAVLAVPAWSLRPGHVDAGADPPSSTGRRAHDLLAAAFGPGANGPLTLVVDRSAVPEADRPALADQARHVLGRIPGTAAVTPLRASPDGAVLSATAQPSTDPQDAATTALTRRLVDSVLPRAVRGYEAHGYVTGATAARVDFTALLAARLPLIVVVLVGLAFLGVLAWCRGVLVAVQAAVCTALTLAASLGVVVAVFQWGWGGPVLGVAGPVPVEGHVPVALCAVLAGVSTGSALLALAPVRPGRPGRADPPGAPSPAPAVLAGAVLVTAGVFGAFVLSDVVAVKMLGLGLAVGVLLDATLVRLALVPALLALLGRRAWWTPWWWDRARPARAAGPVDPPRPEPPRPAEPVGQHGTPQR